MYKLAIIGGGPAGYVAAEKAAKAGLSVVLFEKEELGGVCLNEGCIPTKTLLYSAKIYDYSKHGDRYGVNFEGASLDFPAVMKRKDKVVKKLVGGIKVRMRNAAVEVVNGDAVINGPVSGGFSISCGETAYEAEKLLICTGSSAVVPPIPGVAGNPAVVTNREILRLAEAPSRLVIIGGGVIGMEFASFFNSIGTEVTVVEMLPKILGPMDPDISAMLQAQYAKKGVEFHLSCKVTAVEGSTVVYETPSGDVERAEGNLVLMSVGRRPNLRGFGLENLGVTVERGIVVDSHMQTSVPGVYAAGDVTALSMLAHTASRQAEVAVNHMLGIEDSMSYDAIPGIVYTNPEVAGVGAIEGARVLQLPMAYSGRFVAENERGEGICKVVLDDSEHVIGVHMLGNPCSEIITAATIAVSRRCTVPELLRVVFPHPTVSEILKETLAGAE